MKVGDVVTWTDCRQVGKRIRFSSRKGKIEHITGVNVTVKYRGKLVHLRPNAVRPDGQRLELTEMIEEAT